MDTAPRPGDTIVVPASYGGCDDFGWNPESDDKVTDVADDCAWRARRRPVLRVHPASEVHLVALQRLSRSAHGLQADPPGFLR